MNDLTHCGTIKIATERLYLKRIEKCDATSMHSNFASDDRVSQYMSWESFKTVEDVDEINAINTMSSRSDLTSSAAPKKKE